RAIKAEKAREQKYASEVTTLANTCSKALTNIGEFLGDNPYPPLWTDQEKLNLAASMVTLQLAYGDAQNFDVPAKYTDAHNSLLAGLKKYSDSMTLMAEGIDSLDAGTLTAATDLLNEANVNISDATTKILDS
ncbi:MAG: hypothetical protein Q7K29_05840, partial [Thermoleophilia bacterium]|nr:hypothetical protein [Thermoleophilia bacterium]